MSGQNGQPPWAPSAELLAAYADGELPERGPGARLYERVETWLAAHPDAGEEIEAQRRLTDCCRASAAADPGEEAWAPLAGRLRELRFPRPSPQRRWSRLALLGLTAAAACTLLALSIGFHEKPDQQPLPPVASSEDSEDTVLQVATAAEVEILSVQGEDTGSLVVGELPVEGSLVLLEADELTLTRVEPDRDNMVPDLVKEGHTPLIWAPTDAERVDPEDDFR